MKKKKLFKIVLTVLLGMTFTCQKYVIRKLVNQNFSFFLPVEVS